MQLNLIVILLDQDFHRIQHDFRRHKLRTVNDKALLQPVAVHHIDGLLKLIEVLFKMMMKVDANRSGGDALT